MDLLEQWNQALQGDNDIIGDTSLDYSGNANDLNAAYSLEDSRLQPQHQQQPSNMLAGQLNEETSTFSVHPLSDWTPSHDQGYVTSVSIGCNVLVIGTSKGHLVRWNVETDRFEEILVSKKPEDSVHKVFIGPMGVHVIVSLVNGQNFYLHSSMNKVKLLSRFKGVTIECVGWDHANENPDTTSTILLGGTDGCIYEGCIADEKDKVFQKVYDLFENKRRIPVSGLQVERFPDTSENSEPKFFVMAATPTRYYQFIGGPSFEALFDRYTSNLASFVELPGELNYSELHFFRKFGARASNCAWLTGAGIYYGTLVFGSQEPGDKVVDDGNLLGYPEHTSYDVPPCPISMALTEFHFLLLYVDKLVAINQLNEEIVYTVYFPDLDYGDMSGLSYDPTTQSVWMFSKRSVFEIAIDNEDQGVWRLYLNEGKYQLALEYCKSGEQRDEVYSRQADHYFSLGSYEVAAEYYAKSHRSFEEVTLKFVSADAQNALRVYLYQVLEGLDAKDSTQQVMIATWLTEIYLDKMNRIKDTLDATEDGAPPPSGHEEDMVESFYIVQDEFREFLDNFSDCLNKNTTFDLISSHGRMDDLLYYAELIGDLEWVINHHIQRENFEEALKPLKFHPHPGKIEELYYKFSPTLMQHMPKETVDMLIRIKALDPVKLIPTLMRYELQSEAHHSENHAIRYLETCVNNGGNDPAIHNYLVSLYAKLEDEAPLLMFIEAQNTTEPVYDYKYALRLCHQEGKRRSCVSIYTVMGLYEEAVRLALELDLELAKKVVSKATMTATPTERKKLWLLVARHVIEAEEDIPKAMKVLQECDASLKIEDVLPYFPNFVRIGEFKDEICDSLESYNDTIEKLKRDMDDYTKSANLIRQDIQNLRNRSGFVTSNQKCDSCMEQVLTRQFYLFPCTHVFHVSCIWSNVLSYIKRNPGVMNDTSTLFGRIIDEHQKEYPEQTLANVPPEHWRSELIDSLSSVECMLCGSMMIDMVQEPFISSDEAVVAQQWEI